MNFHFIYDEGIYQVQARLKYLYLLNELEVLKKIFYTKVIF